MPWTYAGTTGGGSAGSTLVLPATSGALSSKIVELPGFTIDTTAVTNGQNLFINWTSLQKLPPTVVTANMTSTVSMFSGCAALTAVPAVLDTAKVTNVSSMFQNCTNLTAVPTLNLTAVAAAANQSNLFYGCTNLTAAPCINVKYSISVANTKLDAAALNTLFSGLATTTGQTVTITGCPGAATCDRSIATNKGWAITG